ncbi:MAG: glycosyltransferase family 4 protein [Candidatus Magasanikbacteria bacterium]|nr:glycosyltransferase family 4 protein [Candidatus Magasanikbacteria bacterium]
MKIGIDARMWGSGFGIGRYIQQLVLHLEKIEREHEYVLFFKKDNWREYEPKNPCFKKVLADIHWYGWEEQTKLTKIFQQERVDLMHFPHWNVPLSYRKPFVLTIHDLLLLHYPDESASTLNPLYYKFKHLAYKSVLRHAAGSARHIFATSEYTKHDIVGMLGVSADKIQVTYQAPFGLEHSYENKSGNEETTLSVHGIQKPFILYVGAAYPHKNLNTLLKAWDVYGERYGNLRQLVLVGKEDFAYKNLTDSELFRGLNRGVQTKQVLYTGFVSDADLDLLYKKAECFVFPSLYEGFGLPPLEAMSRGLPVISSHAGSIPEILGGAASYVDPMSADQMADAIHRVLSDSDLRYELRQAARSELLRYSWDTLAGITRNVYLDQTG